MCKKLLVIAVVILLIPAVSLGHTFYSKIVFFNKKNKAFDNLGRRLEEHIRQAPGNFSIFIKDINYPKFKIAFGEQERFPAASLIKVPLAAVVLKSIKENKLSLSQKFTIQRKDIAGGSGIVKGMNLPVTLSVEELMELMLSRSDNTAANKLVSILGFDYINDSFKKLGLKETILARKMMDFSSRNRGIENYTTAFELGFIFEQAYRGELIDETASRFLISLLKKQGFNDRLPLYLAKSLSIAHKTGLENGIVHDAGIVFSPKGDYIICVLANKIGDYKQAKKYIAKLSLLTYNFYQ